MIRLVTYNGPVTKYSILLNIESGATKLIDKYTLKHINIDVSVLYLTDGGYEELFFKKSTIPPCINSLTGFHLFIFYLPSCLELLFLHYLHQFHQ